MCSSSLFPLKDTLPIYSLLSFARPLHHLVERLSLCYPAANDSAEIAHRPGFSEDINQLARRERRPWLAEHVDAASLRNVRMPCVNISHLNDPRHHPSGRSFRITSPERLRQPYIVGKQPSSIAESGLRCNACSAVTTNHHSIADHVLVRRFESSNDTVSRYWPVTNSRLSFLHDDRCHRSFASRPRAWRPAAFFTAHTA